MDGELPVGVRFPHRILMTTDAVGGVWQYSVDLARALNNVAVEVLLVNMGPRPTLNQQEQVFGLKATRLAAEEFALEWMQEPWADVDRAGDWLLAQARSFRPDLVHLNGYTAAVLDWRAPVVTVAHSCVCSWWRAVHGVAAGDEWAEYRSRVAAGLQACDAIIAPSRYMAEALASEYGVASQKISVIHNFSAAVESHRQDKEPFALAAGRLWDPAKNLALLENISGQVSWKIYVAGDNQAKTGGDCGSGSIHLLGSLPHENLLHWMDKASIFVHPAFYEPFGLSVLEAAQRGCCLMLADIPSLRELWDGAAVFVDPRNEKAWAAELNRLALHREERQRLAACARLRATHFTESKAFTSYAKLYSDLLEGRTEVAA